MISISSRSSRLRPQLPAVPPHMPTTVSPARRKRRTSSVGRKDRSRTGTGGSPSRGGHSDDQTIVRGSNRPSATSSFDALRILDAPFRTVRRAFAPGFRDREMLARIDSGWPMGSSSAPRSPKAPSLEADGAVLPFGWREPGGVGADPPDGDPGRLGRSRDLGEHLR